VLFVFLCVESIVGDDELDVIEEHILELCEEKMTRWNMVKTLSENVNILHEVNQISIDEWSSLNQIKAIRIREEIYDPLDADMMTGPDFEGIKIDKKSMNKYRKSLEKVSVFVFVLKSFETILIILKHMDYSEKNSILLKRSGSF